MRASTNRSTAYACVRAICAALALLALLWAAPGRAETEGMLRVKLARLGSPSTLTLRADCDYTLAADPSVRVPAGAELTVSAAAGQLTLTSGDVSLAVGPSAQLIRDGSGSRGIRFTSPALSNRFCGDLALAASEDVITAILRIYVEDYLYGVVGYELPPSSAPEALKAQAIVARSYALRQKSARGGSAYDLSDAGDALNFRGYNSASEYAAAIRAVDDTRGQALYYGDGLAACYFCESNGGQTESSANALGAALPYTQVMDDPYDLDSAAVKKSVTLRKDGADLPQLLKGALIDAAAEALKRQGFAADLSGVEIAAIGAVVPESPRFAEPSRLYQSLAFSVTFAGQTALGEAITAPVTVHIPTYGGLEDWCDLGINDDDNETVWVSQTDRSFEITFRRHGSGVGMSQRGAQAMAKKGLTCETILDYYYPGTDIRTLALADASQGVANQAAKPASAQPIATARLSQKSRLYQGADTASGALTTLPAGATVTVYGVQGEWAAIGSGDLYGFVRAEGLTSFALSGVTAAQVLDETFAQVSAQSVDVLQLPVKTALALKTLSRGASVRLDAYTDAWALIATADGVEGFIPRDALTLQSGGGTGDITAASEDMIGLLTEDAGLYVNADDTVAPRQSLNKGLYVQILAYNSAWAYVRTADGLNGYVKLSSLSAVRQTPAPQAEIIDGGAITVLKSKPFRYVDADSLPLYESYSTESDVLATLRRGEKVRLGAYNEKWACVRVNGITGFVAMEGLTDAMPEQTPIEGGEVTVVKGKQYATVVSDGAPLYPTWSESGEPIARLGEGERVLLGAYNGQWACVRVDSLTGFMRIEALELGG